jgi:hypothetical protein
MDVGGGVEAGVAGSHASHDAAPSSETGVELGGVASNGPGAGGQGRRMVIDGSALLAVEK